MRSVADHKCVPVAEVESFVERWELIQHHGKALAQVLCTADVGGQFTHGLHRLGKLILQSMDL